MIINTLADYYDYLVEKQEIPAFGWSNERVSHAILLNKDGQIASIVSLKKTNKKGKEYVEKMEVPEHKVKTSGIVPQFMCDSESSLLGIVVTKEAERKNKEVERAKKSFMASVELHHRVLEGVDSDIAKRVLAYFDTWNPEEAYQNKHVISFLKESGIKSFLIFADADTGRAAFEDPKIREAWIRHRNRENADVMLTLCLDKGDYELPERLHPKIKGIPKANPSGASLISFNSNAFESYGKNEAQGLNAPISKINTFKYSSVLNYLLSNKRNTVNLGNITVVFWAEEAEHECESCFDEMIECEITEDDIKSLYNSLAIGNPIEWKKILPKYGFGYDFGLRNMKVEKSELSKKAKFLITFPKPKVPPECFYAILYIDKGEYNYYTLELDLGSPKIFETGGGIICGQKGSQHINYGRRCIEDLDEFDKKVQDIIDGKKYNCNEMMQNIDFNAASEELGMTEDELKEKCIIF